MAGRKKKGKSIRGPFSQLKGFRVSEPAGPEVPVKTGKVRPPSDKSPPENEDLFLREMARLGVQPEKEDVSSTEQLSGERKPDGAAEKAAEEDTEWFLEQLGRLDIVFEDRHPEEEEEIVSASRRMKRLRQGRLKPEATLDLHGLDRHDARQRIRFFLEDMVWQGYKTVLIITGRGLGSGEEGPVLRSEAERFLSNEGRTWVLEWGRAPRRYGGEGALIAFLRSQAATEKK